MSHKPPYPSKKVQSTLVRPKYAPGLLLNDDDLTQAVDYTRDLNRLLFRSLLGCGVICGLEVKAEFKCDKLAVTVGEGIALDCRGDPLHLSEATTRLIFDPNCNGALPETLWVVLRRHDKHCAPRNAICSQEDDDAASVCTRIREGVEVSIVSDVKASRCNCILPPTPAATQTGTTQQAGGQDAAIAAAIAVPAEETQPRTRTIPADPNCYDAHKDGQCGCACGGDCACDVVLAMLYPKGADWQASHAVRRFIRPALMPDPLPPKDPAP